MKRLIKTGLLSVVMLILASNAGMAETPTHLDRFKVKYTCAECHKGHGKRGTPMLRADVPMLCYNCHGPEGYDYHDLPTEVYFDFLKRYRHPVNDTSIYHKQNEILPDKDLLVERHVSCLDCHNPHVSTPDDPIAGVSGVSTVKNRQKRADDINDVCLKCHSDNISRPADSPNVLEELDPQNPSFHPVLGVSRRRSVSVDENMRGKMIDCTDCHSPHGSDNKYMLKYRYLPQDVPESPGAFELCYKCHDRNNILSNKGFSEHRRHIVYESTSCRTCHVAHGSRENERLIGFDPLVVGPNSEGMLQYERTGNESRCFLRCHDADHRGDKVQQGG